MRMGGHSCTLILTDSRQPFLGAITYIIPVSDACLGKTPETIPATYWRYPVGSLEAGDHSLHFMWWLDHWITDLGDYDGNGKPDFFSGTFKDVEISIHVEDR